MISIPALLIVARSDKTLFTQLMSEEGLTVIGMDQRDPLTKGLVSEHISAISSLLSDDINTHHSLTPRQASIAKALSKFGFIVALEGLDQMPGTDCDPIKMELQNPNSTEKEEDEEEGGEEGGEGDPVPPPA